MRGFQIISFGLLLAYGQAARDNLGMEAYPIEERIQPISGAAPRRKNFTHRYGPCYYTTYTYNRDGSLYSRVGKGPRGHHYWFSAQAIADKQHRHAAAVYAAQPPVVITFKRRF